MREESAGFWGKGHGWHGVGVFAVSVLALLFVLLLRVAVDLRGSCTVI
jgi:hypothetical protein